MPKKLSTALLAALCNAGRNTRIADVACTGLTFKVTGVQAASWTFRYQLNGRRALMGLGPYPAVGLAEAREKARALRKLVLEKVDPQAHRVAEYSRKKAKTENQRTVKQVILEFHDVSRSKWAKKTTRTFLSRMTHVTPVIGDVLIRDINRDLIKRVLLPIWDDHPATAREVQRLLAQIVDYADECNYRQDDPRDQPPPNPARNIHKILPEQKESGHHKALPFEQIPEFMAKLREFKREPRLWYPDIDRRAILKARAEGMSFPRISDKFGAPQGAVEWICLTGKEYLINFAIVRARALETAILTALRSVETLRMQWTEVDWEQKLLVIPRQRMKMKKHRGNAPHVVPLSTRVIEILHEMEAIRVADYVFPGSEQGRSLKDRIRHDDENPGVVGLRMGDYAMGYFLTEEFGYRGEAVVHGFRKTFSNWAHSDSRFRDIAIELSLDHVYGTQIERVYRDAPLIEERRELLQAWANYCGGNSADVIQLPLRAQRTSA
jgi:integrase